jgi:hypothetical protein
MDNKNMFFDKIIFYTCDLHLMLNILYPLNIIFLSNGLKNECFALQPFLRSKFVKLYQNIVTMLPFYVFFT